MFYSDVNLENLKNQIEDYVEHLEGIGLAEVEVLKDVGEN